jgi:hypothetical protein
MVLNDTILKFHKMDGAIGLKYKIFEWHSTAYHTLGFIYQSLHFIYKNVVFMYKLLHFIYKSKGFIYGAPLLIYENI